MGSHPPTDDVKFYNLFFCRTLRSLQWSRIFFLYENIAITRECAFRLTPSSPSPVWLEVCETVACTIWQNSQVQVFVPPRFSFFFFFKCHVGLQPLVLAAALRRHWRRPRSQAPVLVATFHSALLHSGMGRRRGGCINFVPFVSVLPLPLKVVVSRSLTILSFFPGPLLLYQWRSGPPPSPLPTPQ